MIKLEINATELTDAQLVHTATYLMALAGHNLVAPPTVPTVPDKVNQPYIPHNATPLSVSPLDVPPAIKDDIEKRIEKAFNLEPGAAHLESVTSRIDPEPVTVERPENTKSPHLKIPPKPELDVEGMPWDARIHSRTQSKYANGTWKIKREVPPALVAQVKKELMQLMSVPKSNFRYPVLSESGEIEYKETYVEPSESSKLAFAQSEIEKPVAPKPPAPPRPPVAAPPAPVTPQQAQEHLGTLADDPNEPTDFVGFMELVTVPVTDGRLPQATLISILQAHGVASVPLVAHRPDLIPGICEAIKNYLNEV